MSTLVIALTALIFLAGFIAGGGWEFCRRGGTYDLQHEQLTQLVVVDTADATATGSVERSLVPAAAPSQVHAGRRPRLHGLSRASHCALQR